MRILILIIISVNVFLVSCSYIKRSNEFLTDCDCNNDNKIGIELMNSYNRIIVCGYSDGEIIEKENAIIGLMIWDCKNNKSIIDYSFDEIGKYIVHKVGNELVVYTTKLILVNDEWDYKYVEDEKQVIQLIKKNIFVSRKETIFKCPKLSDKQNIDLKELWSLLKKEAPSLNQIDEKKIYMLYMGYLSGDKECEYLLTNFRVLFNVDGAISESLTEIGF